MGGGFSVNGRHPATMKLFIEPLGLFLEIFRSDLRRGEMQRQ